MPNENQMSRRTFVKDAAIAGAAVATGGMLNAFGAEPAVAAPSIPEKWDKDVDVIIIGFGIAGSAAALETHDNGVKVLIIEKTKTPGGCATLSGGVVYAAGTTLQKEAGVDDTPDGMFKYWMAMGQGLNTSDMVRIWCDESAGRFEWLRAQGVKFAAGTASNQNPKSAGGKGLYYTGAEPDPWAVAITPARMRGHATSAVTPSWPYPPSSDTLGTDKPNYPNAGGTGLFRPYYEGVKSRGIEVLMETQVTDLVAKLDTKEVLGVKAMAGGKELFIRAKRAVILATGGFAHNSQMLKYYATENGAKVVGTSSINSDTGDGHRMGMALGAQPVNMNLGSLMYAITPGAILVNQGGRRFVDETLTKVNAQAMKGQLRDATGVPVVYEIFDETLRASASKTAVPGGAAKTTIQAPTIKELAAKIGIDPTVLDNTVNNYNEYVKTGRDLEFGRTALQTSQVEPGMAAIKDPPFHARRTLAEMTMTTGGLLINTKTQLVDTNGKVIPRLYAAGTVAHTVVGVMYTSGVHIMSGMVFGRIAGKNAAGETPLT